MGETPDRAPNCLRCAHFYVTWDPAFPRGCRQFEIVCRALPSQEVYAATGRHCPSFELRAGLR
ncbi:MAG TPA: hypothetical protein DCG47_03895 [Spirochaetaceae bacterium]|nr:hypothetical protein [Spirochaetaceae bacterium]